MIKLLRWFRTLVISLALIVFIGLAAGYWAWRYRLPTFVQQQINSALAESGFAQARYRLESISLDRLVLSDIALDPQGRFKADRLEARASIGSMLARRVDELHLSGARWRVKIDDKGIDTGLPPALLSREGGGSLPIDRLVLTDCAIELARGEVSWEIAILDQRPDTLNGPISLWFDPAKNAFFFERGIDQTTVEDPLAELVNQYLPGAQLQGAIGATGSITLDGDVQASIELRDGTVELVAPKSTFAGVSGEVSVTGPVWRTVGHPQLRWLSAQVGELALGAGAVQFQFDPRGAIFIERLFARIGSTGRLWAHALEIDPAMVDMKVNLFWESVELNEFLGILTAGEATGTGRLYGRLPIRIRTQPRLKLTFGEGYLLAEQGGRIVIEDSELVRRVMAANLPAFSDEPAMNKAVEDRFVQALQDFEYRKLRFVVFEEDGLSVLRLELTGAGRIVKQELDLTVNFQGIGGLIDVLLRAKLAMAAVQEKIEAGLKAR